MKTSNSFVSIAMLLASVAACSSGSDDGTTTPTSGGSSGGETTTAGAVTEVSGSVAVPATFSGQPAKIIFGYGSKQITDGNGKMLNVPTAFLPSLAGIAHPTIVAGQSYTMDMTGVNIPDGDYYVLVALYVEGTSGTIPEQGKDYIAGSTTTMHFAGGKMDLPPLTFQVSQGM